MLSKKHFVEFANFLVEEELKIIPRYNQLKADIEELEKGYSSIDSFDKLYRRILEKIINTAKSEILEKMNKYHRELTSEIMLVLDKNSLRFNKYQFKNYIISHVEKKQLNNDRNTVTNNQTITKRGIQ